MSGEKKLFGKQDKEPGPQGRVGVKQSKLPKNIELLRHAIRKLDSLIVKQQED